MDPRLPEPPGSPRLLRARGVVVAVVFTLAFLVLTGAVTRAAAGTFLARDLTIAETYRYGFARLGSILLVAVLVVLAVAAGFILLIIPGFIVLTRLWVSMPAVVIEDRRGGGALQRAWRLGKGHNWPGFGGIIVSGVLPP